MLMKIIQNHRPIRTWRLKSFFSNSLLLSFSVAFTHFWCTFACFIMGGVPKLSNIRHGRWQGQAMIGQRSEKKDLSLLAKKINAEWTSVRYCKIYFNHQCCGSFNFEVVDVWNNKSRWSVTPLLVNFTSTVWRKVGENFFTTGKSNIINNITTFLQLIKVT